MNSKLTNPFVGPRPFIRGETIYGRGYEIRELFYLLTAERIVWLHSPSGAGKTSLISAGLVPRLERDGFEVYPTIRVNLDLTDRHEQSTNRYLLSALISLEEGLAEEQRRSQQELSTLSLSHYLDSRQGKEKKDTNIVLIFDQFEEILTIDPLQVERKHLFFQEIGHTLRHMKYWALFSLREEYLAQMEPYIDPIPTRWSNTFHLDLLGEKAVFEIVKKTAKLGGREFSDEAAQALYLDLAKTKVQQPDGSFVEQTGKHVEPVQLQVVCRRLWDEMPLDDLRIEQEDLRQFGDVSEALGAFYDDALAQIARGEIALERSIRKWVGKKLITSSGIRGQVLRGEKTSEGLANEVIAQLLNTHLVRAEKRAGATWYELAHDRLLQPIKVSNAKWLTKTLQPFQRLAMAWAEQGRPPSGGEFLLKGRALWAALQWKKNNLQLIDEDERALLEISCKAFKRHSIYTGAAIIIFICLMVLWNQTREAKENALAAKEHALAQNEELQRQLATIDWNNGFNEQYAEGDSSLKALHYFARATEGFARIDDTGMRSNALLAHKFVQGSLQLYAIIEQEGMDTEALFSADGQRILTWSANKTARIWDSQTGKELTRPFKHESLIRSGKFSVDGQRILTWSWDDTVRIWDSYTGELLASHKHKSVKNAIFSVDGQRILTWSWDGTARMWDSYTGEPLTPQFQHKESFHGAMFSADGQRILTWNEGNTARVWDSRTGKALTPLLEHEGRILGAMFSADSQRILAWSENMARVWDSQNGKALTSLLEHEGGILGTMFSADRQRILTWSKNGTARVWDSQTGKAITPPLQHKDGVGGAMFSADDQRILTWSWDGTARVWDSQTGKALTPVLKHKRAVEGAMFSADGQRILTWSWNGTARVWGSQTAKALTPVLKHMRAVRGAIFSADEKRILSWSDDNTAQLWESHTGKPLTPPLRHDGLIRGAMFSADGQRILTRSGGGTVRVWDSRTGEPLTLLFEHTKVAQGSIFSADGQRILTWNEDNTARVWDSRTGKALTPLLQHQGRILGAMFSANGQRILTWSRDGTARVWDSYTGEPLIQPIEYQGMVLNMMFSADGQRILTLDLVDGTVLVWDSQTGKALRPRLEHEGRVLGAMFSADGQRILTWNEDNTARVWDSRTGKALTLPLDHQGRILGAMFSADGQRILTWSEDSTARVWDSYMGEPLTPPLEHEGGVLGAMFSADGQRILTRSEDGTARVWDSHMGELLAPPLVHQWWVSGAAFSADGQRILTWSENTARVWDFTVDNWPADKIILKTEVETGTELKATGELQVLSATAWQEKKWCQYDLIQYQLNRIDKQQLQTSERRCNELKKSSMAGS